LAAFGFAQIVGSLQTRQRAFLLTILLWAAILFGGWFVVSHFLTKYILALYIGYGIALISILGAGRIE